MTLPEDYASISLKKADIEPTEEDVQSQIDSLLSQNTTTQQITDRAAADGDTVNIDYVGTVDGVAFTGGTYSGYSLTLGSATSPARPLRSTSPSRTATATPPMPRAMRWS